MNSLSLQPWLTRQIVGILRPLRKVIPIPLPTWLGRPRPGSCERRIPMVNRGKNDDTGKCKKAKLKLKAMRADADRMTRYLDAIRERLSTIAKDKDGTISKEQSDSVLGNIETPMSALRGMPPRLAFHHNRLPFYIEFLLVADVAHEDRLTGKIVYGTYRKGCFDERRFPDKKVEEKPLIQFTIDDMGHVSADNKLDDDWWLALSSNGELDKEKSGETLSEIHHRALARVWSEALNWTNENLIL